jgi:Spy/CpxP family protein refolding chaperone
MKVTRAVIFGSGMCLVLGFGATAHPVQGSSPSQNASSNAAPPPAAQSATPPSGRSNSKMDPDAPENDDALHLTDEQKEKIKSIREDAKQRALDIQKDTSLGDDVKGRKLKQIRKETRAQVFAVMTPDQQQQWIAEQRARREAKRTGSASPQ